METESVCPPLEKDQNNIELRKESGARRAEPEGRGPLPELESVQTKPTFPRTRFCENEANIPTKSLLCKRSQGPNPSGF